MKLECPVAVLEDLDFSPIFRRTADIQILGTDHKVNVAKGFCDTKGMNLIFRVFFKIRVEVGESASQSQMAGRVFIVKGTEEKQAGIVNG